ncbi:MAG: phage scaffolding protein [Dehalobacter sp.]|nr:phage scaffolding protein [Dehalobacter sp.]
MEWLKDLLKASGVEESKIDGIIESVNKETPKYLIPKDKFNEVNEAKKQAEDSLKERDKQLKDLAEKAKGNEVLEKQIQELQEANKKTKQEYDDKVKQLQFDHTLDAALSDAKVKNIKAIKALLTIDNIKLDGESLIGLTDQLEALKKSDAYLFDQALGGQTPPNYGGGSPGVKNPWKKETFNLTDQGKILRENPELAKQLQAAAR